jgi:hypothetical protein
MNGILLYTPLYIKVRKREQNVWQEKLDRISSDKLIGKACPQG